MTGRHFAVALMALIICIGMSFVFASCASNADAQTPPDIDIYHRDFGATTCYYTKNSRNGEVSTLSCVKEK